MSNIVFQRGEILTAEKLNQLVQAVTGGAVTGGAAAGDVVLGGGVPVQTHQVKQREFSSNLPPKHPVYIDQASPHWPLGDGQPGWFWRASASATLTRLPFQPTEGQRVFLQTNFSCTGAVVSQIPVAECGCEHLWNPFCSKPGFKYELLGETIKDPYKAGARSVTDSFLVAPSTSAALMLSFSPPSEKFKRDVTEAGLPSGELFSRFSLIDKVENNSQLFTAVTTDGGMYLRARCECVGTQTVRNLELIPRFVLKAAPSTEINITPSELELKTPIAPGSWHELASFYLGDTTISLNAQWVNSWFAFFNFSKKTTPGMVEVMQTWKKAWPLPGHGQPPGSLSVQDNAWRVVSKHSSYLHVTLPDQWPCSCSWVMREERTLEALGTGDPVKDEYCNIVAYQPVRFRAFLRRQVAPKTCDWCIWNDCCWTNIYA